MSPTRVVHVSKEPFDIYIGRAVHRKGLPQSKWANPYPMAMASRAFVITAYQHHIERSPELLAALPELRGKTLGCWCAPKACHGDILALMANALEDR